jgi:exodeoxyribonuclease V alpha subunit
LPNTKSNNLLTRELLYTAVTRAKQKILIQATENIIFETSKAEVKRASGIIERYNEISLI